MAKTDYGIDPETFVRCWQTSESVAEVVKKLNEFSALPVPEGVASARASAYRKRNVRLKHMPKKTKPRLDADGLNRLIGEV